MNIFLFFTVNIGWLKFQCIPFRFILCCRGRWWWSFYKRFRKWLTAYFVGWTQYVLQYWRFNHRRRRYRWRSYTATALVTSIVTISLNLLVGSWLMHPSRLTPRVRRSSPWSMPPPNPTNSLIVRETHIFQDIFFLNMTLRYWHRNILPISESEKRITHKQVKRSPLKMVFCTTLSQFLID